MRIAACVALFGVICVTIAQLDDPLCAGCVFVNGAAYNKHEDCTKFVQCYPDENDTLQAHVHPCPFSTYWDLQSLTCQPANSTQCDVDFCADKEESYKYMSATNCRGYWRCSDDLKSVPVCCGKGKIYDEDSSTCVVDIHNQCNTTCFSVYEAPPNISNVCKLLPVDGKPALYQEDVDGWGLIKRACSPGTLYNDSHCGCLNIAPEKQPGKKDKCKPEIHLSFDKDHTDQSKFPSEVENKFVTVKDGVAIFNGINSRLIIPRFTNLGWVRTLVIRVNYTSPHQTFSGMARAMVVNSDCGNLPSIMISEDHSHAYFGIGTFLKRFAYTFVPQQANEEKYVEFKFHKKRLTGSNGVKKNKVVVPGYLRNVKCALQIGHADNMEPFEGEIDDLKIYLCDPNE